MRQLHFKHARFESVVVLRAHLVETLGEQVPNNLSYDVGYYEGSQHSKIWLCSTQDLEAMYCKYPNSEITLWCDGHVAVEQKLEMVNVKERIPALHLQRGKRGKMKLIQFLKN